MNRFECVYTRAECHHQGDKCSECPITELVSDEFNECLDLSYQQGIADERPKAFAKGYDSGCQKGRADAIKEIYIKEIYIKVKDLLLKGCDPGCPCTEDGYCPYRKCTEDVLTILKQMKGNIENE